MSESSAIDRDVMSKTSWRHNQTREIPGLNEERESQETLDSESGANSSPGRIKNRMKG